MGALSDGGLGPVRRESIAGWGRHPVRTGLVIRPDRLGVPPAPGRLVARGAGRAYGDAALPAAPDDLVIATGRADRILAFDAGQGVLSCEAGLTLDEIIRVFLPRGWFPAVTPGTRFVTVGGCVACDVHGKNHHRDGSFARFVERVTLVTAGGRRVACGPTQERELFLATVGGMGLTGLIVEVALRLRRVESPFIVVETEAVPDLAGMVDGLREAAAEWPYTVGWIDCLAGGSALGRGVLMRGRHATAAESASRPLPRRRPLRVPLDAPSWLLSPVTMRAFNALYFRLRGGPRRRQVVSLDSFFYPLDAVHDWNRLYGRRGFLQYQCVLPRASGLGPLRALMERLAASGAGSFLAVIKDCGAAGEAYLSFPCEGITLALDLAYRGAASEALIHELNAVVVEAGGRIYLAKDAVTSARDFERMMPRLPRWRAVRDRWDPDRRFRTAQSVRLLGDPP